MSEQILTRGQKLVGLTFNPSGDPKVIQVKQAFATTIDIILDDFDEKHKDRTPSWDENVLRTNAVNHAIDAQMAAVKILTWKE